MRQLHQDFIAPCWEQRDVEGVVSSQNPQLLLRTHGGFSRCSGKVLDRSFSNATAHVGRTNDTL